MSPIYRIWLLWGAVSVLLVCGPAHAEDPLEEVDGTEGWDQVVQPRREEQRDLQAERDAFKREVADWENIRQLWQEQREKYIMEKTAHQRHFKRLQTVHRRQSRPAPKADITEETLTRREEEGDWGDQPGQELFEGAAPKVDQVIDAELGETGAVPDRTRPAPVYIPPPSGPAPDASGPAGEVPDAFKQRTRVDPEAQAAQEEIRRMREAEERRRRELEERKRLEAEQQRRLEEQRRRREEERQRREEEARRKKEAEAAAGAAAAEALLKKQEEDLKKEQEAIRKKAKLKVDEEGQVVDPELKREMEEEEEEEEED